MLRLCFRLLGVRLTLQFRPTSLLLHPKVDVDHLLVVLFRFFVVLEGPFTSLLGVGVLLLLVRFLILGSVDGSLLVLLGLFLFRLMGWVAGS